MTTLFAVLASFAPAGSPLAVLPVTPLRPVAAPIALGDGEGFDWVVAPFSTVFFDTESQLLTDPVHGLVMVVEDGLLVVDDVIIGESARVRVTGPNPLRILATGDVRIEGEIDVSGHSAANVQSLNLANIPQPGGLAGPGGGAGGVGSPETDVSSAQGGAGDGPWGLVGIGGQGGESGYAIGNRNWRRPGGGGGGRFAAWDAEPELLAMSGELGFDSTHPGFDTFVPQPDGAYGALSGAIPPVGGAVGATPFTDGSRRNDYWGVKLAADERVPGELHGLAGGTGGGGGGDALNSDVFPTPFFQDPNNNNLTTTNIKGGAGGGGGGALHVVAYGEISFGATGHVVANGGNGGTGESTFFIDRVGGGGGGGSGGHVVLESGERIVFEAPSVEGDVLSAVGGEAGAGLPIGENPEGTSEFNDIFDVLAYKVNWGGQGGPGLLQLHVPLPMNGAQSDNILLPPGVSLSDLATPTPHVLLPIFLPPVAAATSGTARGERND